MSSSSMLDFCFFDLHFQCPPPLSSLFENGSILRENVPSCLFLGDSDPSRLILEKTLGVGSGLLDMLWLRDGIKLLVGPNLQATGGLDLVLNEVVEKISCRNESKPSALLWGQAPRLDSGVRVRKHVVRGPKTCCTYYTSSKVLEDSDMDISADDDKRDDDDATSFGVFVYNKSQELPKFTSFNLVVTTSSMEDFSNLLYDPPVHELMDILSKLVYTDAHTTSTVANLEGNHEVLSYLSSASEVPFGTNIDVQATEFDLQEMFPDDADHPISSPLTTITHDLEVEQKFKEYDQKLEALTSINVPKAIEEAIQAKVITEMKKQLPTYVPISIAKFVKPQMEWKLKMLNRMYQNKSNETYDTNQKLYNTLYESITLDQEALDAQDKGHPSIKDHILGPSTVAMVKKLKALIKKDKLTIEDLEGAGLEKLKKQYKNDVELEYYDDQLKASILTKA
ncbi:hypothetical protein Tco_0770991 [Tanacetum coccineum]|uniref:Uncharacterized protein n=1 Tax=Tanacetum coccineum TaxID=301880 RepID=A0ABQ4ZES8_9ASTR